jgi:hypothetical protein
MSAKSSSVLGLDAAFEPSSVSARYLVQGQSDPGLLSRLIEPFAKLGTVPSRVHATCESGDGSQMTVDLRLSAVAPRTAELIEHSLRRVIGVSQLIAVVESA